LCVHRPSQCENNPQTWTHFECTTLLIKDPWLGLCLVDPVLIVYYFVTQNDDMIHCARRCSSNLILSRILYSIAFWPNAVSCSQTTLLASFESTAFRLKCSVQSAAAAALETQPISHPFQDATFAKCKAVSAAQKDSSTRLASFTVLRFS